MKQGWITITDWHAEDRLQARLIFFRKEIFLETVPSSFTISISADTRYKLFVNGKFAEYGPSKGDNHVWYSDTVNLSPYLLKGVNTIAVSVLHYPEETANGNHSMFRFDLPRLYISSIDLSGWKYRIKRDTSFYAEEERFAPLQIHEKTITDDHSWMKNDFDDSGWPDALICSSESLPVPLKPENLIPRTIPYMRKEEPVTFVLNEVIPASSTRSFIIDAKEEMTAFVKLTVENGEDSQIEVLYSECYELENGKGKRTDSLNGHLCGYKDDVSIKGNGESFFEPFWFRTFRYVKITVHAKKDLILKSFSYRETGYPLEVKTQVHVNDESFRKIQEISLRSLLRCMQETYIDCPFYEQLQYVMDTRAEILYTYAMSADDRLARKTIDDFARAQRTDGLLNCSYPNTNVNVIPGFSIYYILMLHDHMMYFGDPCLIRTYLPVVHRILNFFASHLSQTGLVEKIGGRIAEMPYWSFIDWAKEWMASDGMPKAGLMGPITLESELYLYGLQHAAELCEYVHDPHTEIYTKQAADLKHAIRTHSMKDGMITDGPGCDDLSEQAQVFGVLSGILNETEGKQALERSITDQSIAKCTVATSFYLFRALEKTGLYEYTDHCWDIWRRMIENDCTTCVEGEYYPRSECHAWGALALYELPSVILGVRPAAAGFSRILVSPTPGVFTHAEGTVHTPIGDISVSWQKNENEIDLTINCDEHLKSLIITK